jgi:hypothetical protein
MSNNNGKKAQIKHVHVGSRMLEMQRNYLKDTSVLFKRVWRKAWKSLLLVEHRLSISQMIKN